VPHVVLPAADSRARPSREWRPEHGIELPVRFRLLRERDLVVTDVILLAVLVAFFALSVLFVRACERIIGPDMGSDAADDAADEPRAAA
jgi:hypothetical protein